MGEYEHGILILGCRVHRLRYAGRRADRQIRKYKLDDDRRKLRCACQEVPREWRGQPGGKLLLGDNHRDEARTEKVCGEG